MRWATILPTPWKAIESHVPLEIVSVRLHRAIGDCSVVSRREARAEDGGIERLMEPRGAEESRRPPASRCRRQQADQRRRYVRRHRRRHVRCSAGVAAAPPSSVMKVGLFIRSPRWRGRAMTSLVPA
jgi:hypothetical protein